VTQRLQYITPPVYPAGESDRLRDLLSRLFKIGYHLVVTCRRLDPILATQGTQGELEALRNLEGQIDSALGSVVIAFRSNRPPVFDTAALEPSIERFKSKIAALRLRMLAAAAPPIQTLELMGFAERYCLAAQDAAFTHRCLNSLDIPLLNGDCSL
jgi:hypothetical protein